jgi:hypothetical protein
VPAGSLNRNARPQKGTIGGQRCGLDQAAPTLRQLSSARSSSLQARPHSDAGRDEKQGQQQRAQNLLRGGPVPGRMQWRQRHPAGSQDRGKAHSGQGTSESRSNNHARDTASGVGAARSRPDVAGRRALRLRRRRPWNHRACSLDERTRRCPADEADRSRRDHVAWRNAVRQELHETDADGRLLRVRPLLHAARDPRSFRRPHRRSVCAIS